MTNSTIKINCATCGKSHTVGRDIDAPESAISMGCNWCPSCEEEAEDYYEEWYNLNESGEIESDDPNQLVMFSIADEVLANHEPIKSLTTA